MPGKELTWEEREKRACAKYIGISPDRISKVETPTDGGGHFDGFRVIINIPVGRNIRDFTQRYCPETHAE